MQMQRVMRMVSTRLTAKLATCRIFQETTFAHCIDLYCVFEMSFESILYTDTVLYILYFKYYTFK
jgi:hypothetical protein